MTIYVRVNNRCARKVCSRQLVMPERLELGNQLRPKYLKLLKLAMCLSL